MYRLLEGLRIVEADGGVAAGYAGKLLAQYGAEVIKIEPPGLGDLGRSLGPFPDDVPHTEKSGLFLYLSANKKSVTANLKHPVGQLMLRRLLAKADALIIPRLDASMREWSLDESSLRESNPSLVITVLSAFGQTGPYRDYLATDLIAWATSGALYAGGLPGREPLIIGSDLSSYATGLLAALGTLVAILNRGKLRAPSIDVSLLDGMVQLLGHWDINGASFTRQHPQRTPYSYGSPVSCADGYIGVNFFGGSPHHWPLFCVMIDRVDLVDNARFATPKDRSDHWDELVEQTREWFMSHTKDEIFKMALAAGVPIAYVPSNAEIPNLEQHLARGFFIEMDYPEIGRLTMPGAPVRVEGVPKEDDVLAPKLGQHNDEVWCALGYSREDLLHLRQEGVI